MGAVLCQIHLHLHSPFWPLPSPLNPMAPSPPFKFSEIYFVEKIKELLTETDQLGYQLTELAD